MTKWITDVLIPYQRVGADPTLISNADWLKWDEELSKKNIYLVAVQNNLIDIIWKEGRPNYSTYQAYTWNISFAGELRCIKFVNRFVRGSHISTTIHWILIHKTFKTE